jgi:hypothetical protein
MGNNNETIMCYILKQNLEFRDFHSAIKSGASDILENSKKGLPCAKELLESARDNPQYDNLGINCVIFDYMQNQKYFSILRMIGLGDILFYARQQENLIRSDLEDKLWCPKKRINANIEVIDSFLIEEGGSIYGDSKNGFFTIPAKDAGNFYCLYNTLIDRFH